MGVNSKLSALFYNFKAENKQQINIDTVKHDERLGLEAITDTMEEEPEESTPMDAPDDSAEEATTEPEEGGDGEKGTDTTDDSVTEEGGAETTDDSSSGDDTGEDDMATDDGETSEDAPEEEEEPEEPPKPPEPNPLAETNGKKKIFNQLNILLESIRKNIDDLTSTDLDETLTKVVVKLKELENLVDSSLSLTVHVTKEDMMFRYQAYVTTYNRIIEVIRNSGGESNG